MFRILLPLFIFVLIFQADALAQQAANPKPADRGPNSVLYDPIIIGGPKNLPRVVFFFWSAVDEQSLTEFRTRLVPLLNAKNTKSSFVLSQIFDARHHDVIGPGALLLCPDGYQAYASNALKYLQAANNVSKVTVRKSATGRVFYQNTTVALFDRSKLLDLNACEQNPQFYIRQTLLASKTKRLHEKYGMRPLPFYVMDGIAYDPKDPHVTSALKAAR